jgi:hypothetical protein
MFRRLLLPLLAVWAGLAFVTAPAAAEPTFPPGLRIGLEPPGDFVVSKRFGGFEDAKRNAAMIILDLPARAYPDLQRSAFAKDQQGVTGLKREIFPFANGIGVLVSGMSNEGGGPIHKWFLMATVNSDAIPDLATLVTVQVPDEALPVYSDAIVRKALASVTFRPTPLKERLGLLPFKLADLAGFRVMQVLPAGGVILTDGPTDDITKQAYMIVSVGRGSPDLASDRGRFANDMLSTAPLRDLKVQTSEPQRINNGAGYETRAQAIDPRGDAVSVVQWLRFGGTGFLRIVGVSKKDDWNAFFMRFRAVRDGIEVR